MNVGELIGILEKIDGDTQIVLNDDKGIAEPCYVSVFVNVDGEVVVTIE